MMFRISLFHKKNQDTTFSCRIKVLKSLRKERILKLRQMASEVPTKKWVLSWPYYIYFQVLINTMIPDPGHTSWEPENDA